MRHLREIFGLQKHAIRFDGYYRDSLAVNTRSRGVTYKARWIQMLGARHLYLEFHDGRQK
jgi:hypothetical protein